jgi:hypothetical protein
MELKETIELMQSGDYRERFKAEYLQTKIRYEKLKAFNTKIEASYRTGGNVPLDPHSVRPECFEKGNVVVEMPPHDCPEDLLREQQRVMGEYLHLLEVRAVIEGIDLVHVHEAAGVSKSCSDA